MPPKVSKTSSTRATTVKYSTGTTVRTIVKRPSKSYN
jgi:hypothetical protein